MQIPLVSIIVPCYNQAQFLHETLNSVLAQTYTCWECIIVNDGSLDNTDEVATKFSQEDNRFKYIFKENGGVSNARNVGIINSLGEYILPLDSDDIIGESYIEKAIKHFKLFPETKLVYCKAKLFGEMIGNWELSTYDYNELLFENMIFSSGIYKRLDYNKTNGYNENLINGLEDWDFWLTLLNETDKVYIIPEICFYYRIRNFSRNRSITEDTSKAITKEIYNNHKEKYIEFNPNIIFMYSQIKTQQNNITLLETEINRIRRSKAYKIGKFILKPLSFLKNQLKIKNANN